MNSIKTHFKETVSGVLAEFFLFTAVYILRFVCAVQLPDNHSALNVLGVFYKDILLCNVISFVFSAFLYFIMFVHFNKPKRLTRFADFLFLLPITAIFVWFGSYIGSFIESETIFSAPLQIIVNLLLTVIYIACCNALFNETKPKNTEKI